MLASTVAPPEAPDGGTIPGQIEIPFVRSDQRQSQLASIPDDTIVVVGQARQKKRKRTKSKGLRDPSTMDGENTAEDEIFDYATMPNILDDVPPEPEELNTRRKKRQKDAKGACLMPLDRNSVCLRDRCQVLVL